jgi:hypothetical protein
MFEPEHKKKHHQMQMLILNQLDFFSKKKDLIRLSDDLRHLSNRFRLLLQTRLFSNTVSSNNGVFKGKVFKQKRDNTTSWKSHQENFDSQTKLRLTKTQQ